MSKKMKSRRSHSRPHHNGHGPSRSRSQTRSKSASTNSDALQKSGLGLVQVEPESPGVEHGDPGIGSKLKCRTKVKQRAGKVKEKDKVKDKVKDKKNNHKLELKVKHNDKELTATKRVPSPEEVEVTRKEMHRINERQRHQTLNTALKKMICALPSCDPNEPESKQYVLKKANDYIQFLEDKIADVCSEMNITHSAEYDQLTFSQPLYMIIDGSQHEIPAGTPVTLDSLDKLVEGLSLRVSKSKSCTPKEKSSKEPENPNSTRISDSRKCKEILSSNEESTESSTAFSHENLLDDQYISGSSMICCESLSDLDTSGVSQLDSSTSSNCEAESFDDGFSSCKTTDKDSSQSQDSTGCISKAQCSGSLDGKGESLANLIRCDVGAAKKKCVPTTIKINPGYCDIFEWSKKSLNQFEQGSSKPPRKSSIQSLTKRQSQFTPSIQLQGSKRGSGISLFTVPTGSGRLLSQSNLGTTCMQVQPSNLLLTNVSSSVAATQQQKVDQRPHQYLHAFPSSNMSTLAFPPDNILNQTLSGDFHSSPTFGYINCTHPHASGRRPEVLPQGNAMAPRANIQPFHFYQQQQGSLFQAVRHTVEIILDVGADPSAVESYCDCELASRRSPLNGFQLFSKVNQRKFRDGWPLLKARDITRLIAQAWQELPDKFKVLYSQRASEWNRWHKAQRERNKTLQGK